jgi:predicted O-methyltransferase YrrM
VAAACCQPGQPLPSVDDAAAALAAAIPRLLHREPLPGFVQQVRPVYAQEMGVENVSPLLYALVRFVKPTRLLEVGAGYSTLWLLQALHDNYVEMRNYYAMAAAGECHLHGTPWCVPSLFELVPDAAGDGQTPTRMQMKAPVTGRLHTVDNLHHAHSTAARVLATAEQLQLLDYLDLQFEDAWEYIARLNRRSAAYQDWLLQQDAPPSSLTDDGDDSDTDDDEPPSPPLMFDFAWLDFGAGQTLSEFFERLWPHMNDGGYIVVHSTLTNRLTRTWLQKMRAAASPEEELPKDANIDDDDDVPASKKRAAAGHCKHCQQPAPMRNNDDPAALLGRYSTMSFLEPHKLFQNSISIFQKRGNGFVEPTYTNYP